MTKAHFEKQMTLMTASSGNFDSLMNKIHPLLITNKMSRERTKKVV